MTKDITTQQNKQMDLTPDKIDLIRKTVAKDANNEELAMFLHLAKVYELDPFLKEILFMKRRIWNDYKKDYDNIPTMMVSRDGLLAIAHRSGVFDGMDTDASYNDKGVLIGASCTVWNKSFSHPIKATVLFKEYVALKKDGQPQALWATKPETMIKKVAEAQALRKAFNIKGVYIQEELEAEIAKDAKTEFEYAGDALKVSETQLADPEAYEKWSEQIRTEMIDAILACETEEQLRSVQAKYKADMEKLMDVDKAHIKDILDSQFQSIVSGSNPSDIMKDNIPVDHEEEVEAEEFGKTYLPKAVKDIQACKTMAELTVWKNKNAPSRMKLETTQREYLDAVLKTAISKYKV